MKIFLIAGARPNFMKIAPIARAFDHLKQVTCKIVHTGQHYDANMSDVFFEELGIRQPDYHLSAGGGTHARQTAKIMTGFEEICEKDRPDLVMVVGDVNSTLASDLSDTPQNPEEHGCFYHNAQHVENRTTAPVLGRKCSGSYFKSNYSAKEGLTP